MCCAWNDVEGEGTKRNKECEKKNKGETKKDVDVCLSVSL